MEKLISLTQIDVWYLHGNTRGTVPGIKRPDKSYYGDKGK
jgi:hypothetical protein